jgi:hypothetical protein
MNQLYKKRDVVELLKLSGVNGLVGWSTQNLTMPIKELKRRFRYSVIALEPFPELLKQYRIAYLEELKNQSANPNSLTMEQAFLIVVETATKIGDDLVEEACLATYPRIDLMLVALGLPTIREANEKEDLAPAMDVFTSEIVPCNGKNLH